MLLHVHTSIGETESSICSEYEILDSKDVFGKHVINNAKRTEFMPRSSVSCLSRDKPSYRC